MGSQIGTVRPILILSLLILFVAFNNCEQAGELELQAVTIKKGLTDQEVEEILNNCSEATTKGTLKTQQQNVKFADTRIETGRSQICEFGTNGNLGMQDGQLRARYEQYRKLNLPAGAVICDIEMQNNLQSFRYDDVFFFTFNGTVLATNNTTAMKSRLTPTPSRLSSHSSTVDFYSYDWSHLTTAGFQNVANDYCLGKSEGLSTCSWPVTEQQGQIKFDFNPELLVRMSGNVGPSDQTFGFVITGDNDPSKDCYHEDLEFTMKVKYYLK